MPLEQRIISEQDSIYLWRQSYKAYFNFWVTRYLKLYDRDELIMTKEKVVYYASFSLS